MTRGKTVTDMESPKLATALEVSINENRLAVYSGIFQQFIEFANNPEDETASAVAKGIKAYKEKRGGGNAPLPTPLHPRDGFSLSGNNNRVIRRGFRETFRFNWNIINTAQLLGATVSLNPQSYIRSELQRLR
jgi:hypothetical protein